MGVCISKSRVSSHVVVDMLSCWAGSVLEWSEEDLYDFASCFSLQKLKEGKEIPLHDNAFFVVAEGSCELQAILPTFRKKTGHIRQFLCKKDKGDMLFLPSIRNLISLSSQNDFRVRETIDGRRPSVHKIPIIDVVDTISAKSLSQLKLLQLDWNKFDKIFDECRSDRSTVDTKMLRVIMETNLTDYLTQLPFLENMPYSKLETLVRMCRYQVVKEGSVICHEGELSSDVFFVLSGEVCVEARASKRVVDLFTSSESTSSSSSSRFLGRRGSSIQLDQSEVNFAQQYFFPPANEYDSSGYVEDADGSASISRGGRSAPLKRRFTSLEEIELARLGPGEYFGVMSTLTELPRSATVTATSNALFATISRSDFKSFVKVSPSLEPSIERMATGHMLLNLFQLKSPFLTQISLNQARRLGEKCSIQKFNQDVKIFREGENAGSFYFVYSGSLKVEKKDDNDNVNELGHLYSGDYFGELSIILGSHRVSSVTTTSKTILLAVSGEDTHVCLQDNPQILAELIVRMKGRQVNLNDLLKHSESKELYQIFLEEMHGEENLRFYDAATSFLKKYEERTGDEVKAKAEYIVKRFLTITAPEAINVPHNIYKQTQDDIERNPVPKAIFETAKKEIYTLMERDLYQRFKKSKHFLTLLNRIGVYDDLDTELLA